MSQQTTSNAPERIIKSASWFEKKNKKKYKYNGNNNNQYYIFTITLIKTYNQ